MYEFSLKNEKIQYSLKYKSDTVRLRINLDRTWME
jgi:hypothetical protein